MPLKYFMLVLVIFKLSNCDLFSSVTDWKKLFHFEGILIRNIETCLLKYSDGSENGERVIKEYIAEHSELNAHLPDNFNHPTIAFVLMRRLQFWRKLKDYLVNSGCTSEFLMSETINTYLPDDQELNDMTMSLLRLQKIYKLNATDLAKGVVNGVNSNNEMTVLDCFNIGYYLFNNSEHKYATPWFYEAIARAKSNLNDENLDMLTKIYGYLSHCLFLEGKLEGAINSTDEALKISPNDQGSLLNKRRLLEVTNSSDNKTETDTSDEYENLVNEFGQKNPLIFEQILYKKLCRNEIQLPTKLSASLKCKYLTTRSAFTKIAPFKVEEVFLEPYIVVFHDVLYDGEIEKLKELSQPHLTRSSVKGLDSDEPIFVNTARTSQIIFLDDILDKCVEDISVRVQDMTDLSKFYSEEVQVASYGIGGHYIPHWDYFTKQDTGELMQTLGDRIATVLFYLNEVDQGGATVFPFLNLTLTPQKGSAAFWYNLHASGEVDWRTRHAACPVLVGNKWVINKWIREKGQEFIRPCLLQSDTLEIESLIESI